MSDERVAVLESQRESDQASILGMSKKLDDVAADVLDIKLGLAKQKGFLAGCMFVLLPIWTVFTIAASAAWDWFTSGGQTPGQ